MGSLLASWFLNSFLGKGIDKAMIWIIGAGGLFLLGMFFARRNQKAREAAVFRRSVNKKRRIDDDLDAISDPDLLRRAHKWVRD